jgi:hypothetical protein
LPVTRRKGEQTTRMSERAFPHLVELPLPSGGFGDADIEAFHRHHGVEPRPGRGRVEDGRQWYVRFCFAEPAVADTFRDRFGGERLTYRARA